MSECRASPAPASLPDNEDMLLEVLLRLPPLPSSLPRASLVCKRWRRLLSDLGFLRRFRAHHRTPPLLGYFYDFTFPVFEPLLDAPNRIPSARLSLRQSTGRSSTFLGCRHGLAAFLDVTQREAVVWEPVTGSQCRIAFPPEAKFDKNRYLFNGGVLSATGKYSDGYVLNDRQMSPFKLVLLFCNDEAKAVYASIYESESQKWSSISSILENVGYFSAPAVLIRNALCCLLDRCGDILEFDLDTQSLAIIQKPEDVRFTYESLFRVLGTEDRGLCLAIISEQSMQLWGRVANSNETIRWVLQKTVELDQLLSVRPSKESFTTRILGFDEDSNVIFLLMAGDIFTIQLESMQFEKHPLNCVGQYYPYRSFYAAGWGIGGGDERAKML